MGTGRRLFMFCTALAAPLLAVPNLAAQDAEDPPADVEQAVPPPTALPVPTLPPATPVVAPAQPAVPPQTVLAPPVNATLQKPRPKPAVPPPPADRPKAIRRPWWGLGVSEATYRTVLPNGRDTGVLPSQEQQAFWASYTRLRQESLLLDAAQLALLVTPVAVTLAAATAVPLVAIPAFTGISSDPSPAQRMVGALLVGLPAVALGGMGLAALCTLGLAGLAGLDAQDVGAPGLPVKATEQGSHAVMEAERGTPLQVGMGVAAAGVGVGLAVLMWVVPWGLPLVLAPALGLTPWTMFNIYRGVFARAGPVALFSGFFAHMAVAALMGGVPLIMAGGYAARALASRMASEPDGEDAPPGDDRDISSLLNPFQLLFPAKDPKQPPR